MALTRRALFTGTPGITGLFVGLTALSRLQSARAQPRDTQDVSFRWRVPTAYYQTLESTLTFRGSIEQEHDTKGLPLVAIFIGVAMLPSLVDAILTLRQKLVQPGLKIDTRGTEIKIDVDSTLPRGTILLVDNSGTKLYEPNQLTDPAELAKTLISARSK